MQFAKRGVPPSLRARVYKKILYAEVGQKDLDYYAQTTEVASKWETALDDLINADIFETCNDDKYFIFQDMMEACIHFFFRDKQVWDQLKCKPNAPIAAVGPNDRPIGFFPPCGVLPVQHFSRTFAPFCYISTSKEEAYFIYRSFFTKYQCYLLSISSHPHSILSLSKLFEDLLQMYEPDVFYHLS